MNRFLVASKPFQVALRCTMRDMQVRQWDQEAQLSREDISDLLRPRVLDNPTISTYLGRLWSVRILTECWLGNHYRWPRVTHLLAFCQYLSCPLPTRPCGDTCGHTSRAHMHIHNFTNKMIKQRGGGCFFFTMRELDTSNLQPQTLGLSARSRICSLLLTVVAQTSCYRTLDLIESVKRLII